jgi:hypothetical protein
MLRSPTAVYLRDLAIELSDEAVLPPEYTRRQFHDSTHAVVEAYLDALPRRRVKVADAAKIIVCVGPRPSYGIGTENDLVVYPDGVAFVWLAGIGLDIDLTTYIDVDQVTQQQMLLSALHGALLAMAARAGGDARELERARQTLFLKGFPLPEISEQELHRRWGLLPKPVKKRKTKSKRANLSGRWKKRP